MKSPVGFSLLLLLLLLFLQPVRLSATVISVPDESNQTLEHYLCQGYLQSDTTIILKSNMTHTISPTVDTNTTGSICAVSNLSNITIVAESHPATVLCTGTYLATRRGFVFHNVTYLIIKDVTFVGCGGILTNELVSYLNDSKSSNNNENFTPAVEFYFGICQPAALVFDACPYLELSNLQIKQYQGIGVMLSNSYVTVVIKDLIVSDHIYVEDAPPLCYPSINSGSAVLIYYQKTNSVNEGPHVNINITNSSITGGYTDNYGGSLVDTVSNILTKEHHSKKWPLIGAGGLTVIVQEAVSNVVLIEFDGLFIANNTGLQSGGVLILFIDILLSSIKFRNTVMEDNCIIDPINHYNFLGRSLTVYFLLSDEPVILLSYSNTTLLTVSESIIGGVASSSRCTNIEAELGSYTDILIRQMAQDVYNYVAVISNTTFKPKLGTPNRGSALALYASTLRGAIYKRGLNIRLDNVTACGFGCVVNNSLWSCNNVGVFFFADIVKASIVGGLFSNNTGASVISTKYSNVYLSHDPVFSYNFAETYGAITLAERSFLYFVEPLHAVFKSNRALLGAAIYGVEDNSLKDECVLQFVPKQYYDMSNYTNMSITIEMDDNKAELAGNVLYGSPIKHCKLLESKLDPMINNLSLLFDSIFVLKQKRSNNHVQDISSTPTLVCSCNHFPSPCESNFTIIHRTAHPGQEVNISIAAFDVEQKVSVYSLVTAQFYSHGIPGVTALRVNPQQVIIQVQAGICTTLSYNIFHSINRSLTSYPIYNVQFDIGPYTKTPRYVVNLTLVDCPPGFYQANSSCLCIYENRYFRLTCNYQNGSVNHPPSSWIGLTGNGKYGYSSQCPPAYCHPTKASVNLSDSDNVCYGERTGTLCGGCPDGLSVVFGTAECKECSNAYLATILVYALAGIVLVLFLFVLQLTLTSGTINGLIFYVNILGSTDAYLLGHRAYLYYLKVFIALLNLELGFPLCFYHGMNEVTLRCLQFVFPVYIWTIVIVIIILSRYSSRLAKLTGRQSVRVLATLIYLSFSKITITIVNAFTSATVMTEDGDSYAVWYFHGHLKFGNGLHLIPMLLSLLMLCLFVIPFTVLTTLSPYLTRFRIVNRYMPLTDAVFAPYKDKWRFWFGARLCLLVITFIIAAVLRGTNVKLSLGIQHVLVVAFSLVQAFVHPFKNTLVAILDLSFMVNFSLIAFIVVYTQEENNTLHDTAQVLVSLALVVFIGIIVFHCYKIVKCRGTSFCKERSPLLADRGHSINLYDTGDTVPVVATESEIPDIYDYGKYREPLLSLLPED